MSTPISAFLGVFEVLISVIVALILTLLPLPVWADWWRPEWMTLVVIYWTLTLPHRFSVGFAWLMGLLLDAVGGTLLGEQAFALAVVAYLTVKWHRRIRVFPVWQQSLTVFGLTLLFQSIIFLIQGLIGELPQPSHYWLPSVTSMLLWPWVLFACSYFARTRQPMPSLNDFSGKK